jgi:TolB-like protein
MNQKILRILRAILILLVLTLIQTPSFSAKVPKKVAILPFTMHADRDLTFLQEGIMDMLGSRLAWKGEVEIQEKGKVKRELAHIKGPMDKDKALLVGKALQADYVILGSLTVFGESVSIDAKILDVAKSEELITAFNQSKGMDEVIPTVNQFAMDINSKIMGRQLVPPQYALAPQEPETPKGPPGLIKLRDDALPEERKKLIRLKVGFLGMDIGDVDGDGQNEMVTVGRRRLYVYKWQNGALAQIINIKGKWSPHYIWVDVADLNGNGRAEIYISNLTEANVSSLIMEWQGNKPVTLASGLRWFLRVIDYPGEGKILIGQQRKISRDYVPGIHRLKMENNRLVDAGVLDLPRGANIFNFAVGDIVGEDKADTVYMNNSGRLYLQDETGQRLWTSETLFGGTLKYWESRDPTERRIHFSPRVLLTDLDGNGRSEVAVCKNKDLLREVLESTRVYRGGALDILSWDGSGLSAMMKTIKLPGAVADYQVGDVDNDGQLELVVVSLEEGWRFWGKTGKSSVLIVDLEEREG